MMSKSLPKAGAYLLSAFLFLLLSPYQLWADIYYEQTLNTEYIVGRGKTLKEATHQKVYIQDKKVRIEDVESGKVLLIRFDKEMLYHLDTKKASYSEANFRSLRILQGQQAIQAEQLAPQRAMGMGAARSQMLKMAEGLAPERRSFMEQMMMRQQARLQGTTGAEKADGAPLQAKETGQAKTINGFPCRRLKIVQDKKKLLDTWVTTKAGPTNYFSEIVETLGLFKPDVLTALKGVEGFPIYQKYRIQTGDLAGILQSVEVTKLETPASALSSALFSVPKKYTQRQEPGGSSSAGEGQAEESF